MTNTFQRHWFTIVRRSNAAGMLDAQTVYRGTDCEAAALLQVEAASLKITGATWESYTPVAEAITINGLAGVEAYFGCGPDLKRALSGPGEFARSLFAETVRGIIQAETFLLAERGFNSPADYGRYWEEFYAGTCRYYSHLNRVKRKWDEYACSDRKTNLFNRFKAQSIYRDGRGGCRAVGLLSDSFHELGVELLMDENMVITAVDGALLRAPDEVCSEATQFLGRLVGTGVAHPRKKDLAVLLGAGEGCVHLIDLVHDAMESVKIWPAREGGKI